MLKCSELSDLVLSIDFKYNYITDIKYKNMQELLNLDKKKWKYLASKCNHQEFLCYYYCLK